MSKFERLKMTLIVILGIICLSAYLSIFTDNKKLADQNITRNLASEDVLDEGDEEE